MDENLVQSQADAADFGAERIVELINWLQVNKNQFAMSIGVPQAILSHILSGRNKPSLDVIRKILLAYPQLNAEWLLLGKGEMFRTTHNAGLFDNEENKADGHAAVKNATTVPLRGGAPKNTSMPAGTAGEVQDITKPIKTLIFIYNDNTSSIINF